MGIRWTLSALLLTLCAVIIEPRPATATDFRPLEEIAQQAVSDGVFPGTSIAVIHRGRVVFHRAFGRQAYSPSSRVADTTTIYDLASLTKAVVTTGLAMQLVERDSLDLDAPVARYLPKFGSRGKEKVRVRNLMLHNSGLRAHTLFHKTCRTPDEVFRAIDADTLLSAPGTKTLYSDLGFITLGRIVATITGKNLEANFRQRFAIPLGMRHTLFNPPSILLGSIAPTEQDTSWHFETKRPLVHDQNAALLGGVAGHAGLFSTTGDLVPYVLMLMQNGSCKGKLYARPETVRRFTSRSGRDSRALGWDLRSIEGSSSAGTAFSASSWGHLGFTGTSIWVDPEKDLAVIMLSNRVHPSSDNIKIRKFRPLLHDTVVRCISGH
ncbi:MAG: beta-lactamase family protein [Chlorobium sp.]|uniref:serine hydrolase domain-containing protein n=1 Tax=Chlorobium sp. TaxID=1095 RepID=UPI0025C0575C|nr:serine hydrolase domain-containing protein [Chlorobium sp.]MCF8382620.1 beta-lactamase family protein [Chlorobium sp.]